MTERFLPQCDPHRSQGDPQKEPARPPRLRALKGFRRRPLLTVVLLGVVLIAPGSRASIRFQTNRAYLALVQEPGALSVWSQPEASTPVLSGPPISLLTTSIRAADLRLVSRLLMAGGYRSEAESILSMLDPDPVTGDLRARLQAANSNWDTALQIWRDLEAPRRLVSLGDFLKLRDEGERALEAYRAAFECRPPYEPAYYRLGWAEYRLHRDVESAERIFGKAQIAFPESPWPSVNIGDLLIESGKARSAIDWYQKALRIAPGEAGLPAKLAWAYVRLGDWERQRRNWRAAERAYEIALERSCDSTEAYHGLARRIWEEEGDLPSARAFLERAIRAAPKDIRAYLWMGDLLKEAGLPEARNWYLQGNDILQSHNLRLPEDFFVCASLEVRLGRFEAARPCALEAVRLRPERTEYRMLLGDIVRQLEQPEEALREYETSIILDPKWPGLAESLEQASE